MLRTVRVKRGRGLGVGGLGAEGRGLIVTLGAGVQWKGGVSSLL